MRAARGTGSAPGDAPELPPPPTARPSLPPAHKVSLRPPLQEGRRPGPGRHRGAALAVDCIVRQVEVVLQPLTAELLLLLISAPDRLFEREELHELLWPGVRVTEAVGLYEAIGGVD